jgi:hypothetical protein
MATLTYRRNNILKLSGSYLVPAASYKVAAFAAGAMVSGNQAATAITVRSGHGFANSYTNKVIVYRPSASAVVAGTFQAITVSGNTITFGSSVTVSDGDLILLLGNDAGTTSPLYTASTISIYSDSAGGSAVSSSKVTANASGEYEYWHNGIEIDELVLDTDGLTVRDCIPSAEQGPQVPTSVTDNSVVLFDGTGGRQLKASVVTAASGTLAGVTSLSMGGALSGVTSLSMGGALSGVTSLSMGGALTGVTTITQTGGITGGIPRNVGTWQPVNNTPGSYIGATTTSMYVGSIFVPTNMTVTGIQFLIGTATPSTQKVICALYGQTGTRVAQSVAGGTTMTGTPSIKQQLPFSPGTYAAIGPAWYFIGLMFDANTANLACMIPAGADTGTGVVGAVVTGLTAVTPPASITVPTTFPGAASVPITSLY